MMHPELFTKKTDVFKGTISRFPRLLEKPDSWLDSAGANLTRLINGDRVHLTDVLMDDMWFGAFSVAMNKQQHSSIQRKHNFIT